MLDVFVPEKKKKKIRKYTTLAPDEMTSRVTTSSLNAERYIIFKKITNKIDIDIEDLGIRNNKS